MRTSRLAFASLMALSLPVLAGGCSVTPGAPPAPDGEVGEANQTVQGCVTVKRGFFGNTQDAYLSQGTPTQNYGGGTIMIVDAANKGLVQFDLSFVPPSATLTSATLKLYTNGAGGTSPVRVHDARVPWNESSVTWASYNPPSTPALATFVPPQTGVSSIDLTSLTQGWLSGATPNNGVLLEAAGATTYSVFISSEGHPAGVPGKPDPTTMRPELVVCYDDPVNHCSPQPCLNGGVCVNGFNGFTCQCPQGFSGASCQIDICAGVVCPPIDACHAPGTCSRATGQCVAGPSVADTTTGLTHQWTFEEGSGATTADSAGSTNGVLGSSARWGTSFDGSGAIFMDPAGINDTNIYVDFGAAPGQFGTADFSVSFWVATTYNTSGHGDLVGNRVDASNGDFLSCRLTAGGLVNSEIDNFGANYNAVSSSPATINDGNWHNVIISRSGATLSEYIDGALVGSSTSAAPTNIVGAHPFKLGRSLQGFLTSFAVLYDDLRIYDRPLDTCDAVALTGGHAGTPATFPPPSCPCAGSPAWDAALAQTADSCFTDVGFVEVSWAGGAGDAFAFDDPFGGSCSAFDPNGNFVQVDNISSASAQVCLAQLTPKCP